MASAPLLSSMGPVSASPQSMVIPGLTPLDSSDYASVANGSQQIDFNPLGQAEEEKVIKKLKPGNDLHKETLQKLEAMFRFSSGAMSNHSSRWGWMEQKIQAYIRLPDYKQAMDQLNNDLGAAPEPVKVIVPYSYATIHAAATFLANVLLGRRPIFPLMAVSGTTVDKARHMEQAVQANIEASKGYEVLWQYIWDSLIYGFGVTRIGWEERNGKALRLIGGKREMVDSLKFAGNMLHAVDPYQFFPDPRVPMHQVAEKGDFVFWVTQQSKMILKDMEKAGALRWVDEACNAKALNGYGANEMPAVADMGNRRLRMGQGGLWTPTPANVTAFTEVREGTVRLVPKDWKFGDSDVSELWKFTWVKNGAIMQAEPLGMVHEKHPVSVTEPTSLGHEFGALSMADMIGPFQDIISWLVNSRMENVRTTINNQFIVDPARIEMQDLRAPAPGKAIRLKMAAMGTPVSEAIQQLNVMDNTQGHINDIQVLRMLADTITGINDNMRGIQTSAGRRSATEARMSMQAGASRLSQIAVRISSQGMTGLAEQMISNIQQFMPDEMWVSMVGEDGKSMNTLMTPDMIVGSFNYQISDGSLPYDKMALIEVWKEILFGVAQDPELRQRYDIGKIFDHVAILGGAKNIVSFEKQQQQQQPQIMPPGGAPPEGAIPMGAAMPPAPGAVAGALA